jgi:hypothetical protein
MLLGRSIERAACAFARSRFEVSVDGASGAVDRPCGWVDRIASARCRVVDGFTGALGRAGLMTCGHDEERQNKDRCA